MREPPRYGRLERLRGLGKWVSTKRFYSRQLEKGKVRYVHIPRSSSSVSDSFHFIVTVPSNPSSTTTTPATSSSIVAYIEDVFKIDIISNAIRVRKLSIMVLMWLSFRYWHKTFFHAIFVWVFCNLTLFYPGFGKTLLHRGGHYGPPVSGFGATNRPKLNLAHFLHKKLPEKPFWTFLGPLVL